MKKGSRKMMKRLGSVLKEHGGLYAWLKHYSKIAHKEDRFYGIRPYSFNKTLRYGRKKSGGSQGVPPSNAGERRVG
jgi:hypothetical protein